MSQVEDMDWEAENEQTQHESEVGKLTMQVLSNELVSLIIIVLNQHLKLLCTAGLEGQTKYHNSLIKFLFLPLRFGKLLVAV